MVISRTIHFLSTGWHVRSRECTGGYAVIPLPPLGALWAWESARPVCPQATWVTGNYFTFGLDLFWQSSDVTFISSFFACKCPFYSCYSYRIYSSLFLKLLIPASSFLFKLLPSLRHGVLPKMCSMFKCWYLAFSSNHSTLWPLLSSFQSSKWQLRSFSCSASWVYEEHYFLSSYASLKLSLYTYQHKAMPGYFVDFLFFSFFLGILLHLLIVTWSMQAL